MMIILTNFPNEEMCLNTGLFATAVADTRQVKDLKKLIKSKDMLNNFYTTLFGNTNIYIKIPIHFDKQLPHQKERGRKQETDIYFTFEDTAANNWDTLFIKIQK